MQFFRRSDRCSVGEQREYVEVVSPTITRAPAAPEEGLFVLFVTLPPPALLSHHNAGNNRVDRLVVVIEPSITWQ